MEPYRCLLYTSGHVKPTFPQVAQELILGVDVVFFDQFQYFCVPPCFHGWEPVLSGTEPFFYVKVFSRLVIAVFR